MHSYNWDDLRIAHYVAQTGSLSGAAELLGVAHTTVLRRINAFEAQTGAQLFERTPQGYLVNHDRLKAFEAIAKAGKAIEEAQQEISKASVAPGEALRLTSTDTFCAYVLPEIVANIRKSDPDLKIALFSFNTHLNLAHGHVDLTVRPSLRLPDDMDGEIVAELGFAVFTGPKRSSDWIGLAGPLSRSVAGEWLENENEGFVAQADSFVVLREMIARDVGQSLLPCYLGDNDPRLTRVSGAVTQITTPVWVAGHKNLSDTGQLRRFRRKLADEFEPIRERLLGRMVNGVD